MIRYHATRLVAMVSALPDADLHSLCDALEARVASGASPPVARLAAAALDVLEEERKRRVPAVSPGDGTTP